MQTRAPLTRPNRFIYSMQCVYDYQDKRRKTHKRMDNNYHHHHFLLLPLSLQINHEPHYRMTPSIDWTDPARVGRFQRSPAITIRNSFVLRMKKVAIEQDMDHVPFLPPVVIEQVFLQ